MCGFILLTFVFMITLSHYSFKIIGSGGYFYRDPSCYAQANKDLSGTLVTLISPSLCAIWVTYAFLKLQNGREESFLKPVCLFLKMNSLSFFPSSLLEQKVSQKNPGGIIFFDYREFPIQNTAPLFTEKYKSPAISDQ